MMKILKVNDNGECLSVLKGGTVRKLFFFQVPVASNVSSYKSSSALVLSSVETEKSWVMDSECSYNMCPMNFIL